ncbi:MAG: flagellar brake protein [Pseudomonadota bacterium]
MLQDTKPAPLDDALDDFRVAAPAEVVRLLKSLMDGATPLHLSAPDGSHYTTLLWTIDTARRRLSFSADADAPQLPALVEAGEGTAVAYLDSVKLQFDAANLVLVHGDKSCALQCDLPSELFRFQRRNSFRVRTLPRSSPTVSLRHPSIPDMVLALRVLDVSTGGCALFLPNDVPPLAPGVTLHGVRVELDANTRFEATLQLCHVTSLNPQSNGVRLGCELQRLDGDAQRTLQRYIDQTQKRRRLMALD